MNTRPRIQVLVEHVRQPLYRDAYALVIANGLTAGFGVLYWAFAARLFPPEDLGVGSVLISTMLFLSAVSQLNARVALLRFVPEAGRQTARFVVLCYGAAAAGAVLLGIVFIATLGIWASGSPSLAFLRDPGLAVWFVASIAVWSIFNIEDGLLTGLGKATIVPLENGIYGAAKLLLLIGFSVWADQEAIFASWTIPAAIIVVVLTIYAFGRLIPAHALRTRQRSFTMSRQRLAGFLALDYLASLFATTTLTLLPAIVVSFGGAAEGAYFYIPWVIVTSVLLVPLYLSASLTVQAAVDRATMVDHVRRTLVHLLRVLVPTTLGFLILAPVLLSIFGQRYAEEGSNLLRLASLGLVPYAINVLFLAVARVQGRGRVIVAVQASATVLTLALSVLLLPGMGISGVGVSWLVANAAVSVFVVLFGLRPFLLRSATAPSLGPSTRT